MKLNYFVKIIMLIIFANVECIPYNIMQGKAGVSLPGHLVNLLISLLIIQWCCRIGKYVACIGNPEEMAHRSYTDYSAFISAFQEPDLGAKNSILRYILCLYTCLLLDLVWQPSPSL